jgi:hypothetical protein
MCGYVEVFDRKPQRTCSKVHNRAQKWLNDLQHAPLERNVVYVWDNASPNRDAALWPLLSAGLPRPDQREDEYGLRARSETTSNSASSTKFITTEEPP